jgi:pilus assembly protein Flp/PilA
MTTWHVDGWSSSVFTLSVINNLTQRSGQMVKQIVRFMQEEEGTTAVEYGLMIALISAALVAAVALLGGNLAARFNTVAGIIAS